MKDLKFGDKVLHNPTNEKAVVISAIDDDGCLFIVRESTLEQELAHVDDCKILDSDFIRRCQMAEQQLTGFWAAWGEDSFNEEFGYAAASMGLTAEEWDYIKNHIGVEYLSNGQVRAIEEYLAEREE